MKQRIQNAHDIINGVTGQYRNLKDSLRSKITEIDNDRDLSDEGRQKKKAAIREQMAKELVKFAASTKKNIQVELEAAKKDAYKLLDQKPVKPDERTMQEFEQLLHDLRVKLSLAAGAARAKQYFDEFMREQVKDDAFKLSIVKERFPDIASPIMAKAAMTPDGASIQLGLQSFYDGLQRKIWTEDQQEAARAIETIENLSQSTLFNSIVMNDIRNEFGPNYTFYVQHPEHFADTDKHPELKAAAEKAKQSGRTEDMVAYVTLKNQIE